MGEETTTRSSGTPSVDTKYGKRWHARRRGEPMKSRAHETRPWWYFVRDSDVARLEGKVPRG